MNHDWRFCEAIRDAVKNRGKRAAGLIAVPVERVFNVRADGLFGIILYLRLAPQVRGLVEPSYNATSQRFREHLAGLMECGYVIRPLREVLRNRASGLPPPRTVVVTFDDGFASVYAHAWPVLKEFKAPATIFLNTAFMDSGEPFPLIDGG